MFLIVGAAHSESFLNSPEFSPVRWLEGMKEDDSAPEYLMASQRPRGQLDNADFSTLLVKVGDLGGGMMHPLSCWCKNLTYHTSCEELPMQSVASNTSSLPCT